jgi:hypothetical protein
MRYFLDTEFNGFGGQLISLALVPEYLSFPSLYLVAPCKDPGPWVAENVIPILSAAKSKKVPLDRFGKEIARFLSNESHPIIVADWPDDIRYFCECLITKPGEMVNIPSLTFQMIRVDAYPTTVVGAVRHNAYWDAMALRQLFDD